MLQRWAKERLRLAGNIICLISLNYFLATTIKQVISRKKKHACLSNTIGASCCKFSNYQLLTFRSSKHTHGCAGTQMASKVTRTSLLLPPVACCFNLWLSSLCKCIAVTTTSALGTWHQTDRPQPATYVARCVSVNSHFHTTTDGNSRCNGAVLYILGKLCCFVHLEEKHHNYLLSVNHCHETFTFVLILISLRTKCCD